MSAKFFACSFQIFVNSSKLCQKETEEGDGPDKSLRMRNMVTESRDKCG